MATASVIVREAAIPVGANALLAALVAGVNVGCGVLLPLVALPRGEAWLLALVPLVLLSVTHWALIHEAIHRHLLPARAADEALGRALAILFGSPLGVLRFGHLSHHSLNSRPVERAEIYDPSRTPRGLMVASYYARLLAGLHLAEMLSSLACFLPRSLLRPLVRRAFYEGEAEAAGMAERAERQLLDPRQLRAIRLDGALALAWLAACLALYGPYAWAFGLAVLGRALLVSFLDNAPHYEGVLGDPGQGFDSQASRLVMPLILNTNLHGTHHRHPNLPWSELPRALDADAAPVAGSYFALPWRQLRGPLAWPPQANESSLKG